MAGDDQINIDINSRFEAAGLTQAQKGIVDLNQSAQQIVAGLRAAAAAAGQDETAFLGMAGAASQAALATGDAAKAEEILAVSMHGAAQAAGDEAKAQEEATAATGKSTTAIQDLRGALNALGGAYVALRAVHIAADLVETGAAAQRQEVAFNNLAKAAGTTGAALLSSLQSASHGEISNLNLELEASKAEFLGVAKSAQDFSTLMAIARNNAQQMGLTTQQAFDKLVDGLDKGSARALKQVGLNIDLKAAEETYAQSIGKTVGQLDAEEKKQALVAAAMQQGRAQLAATGGAVEGLASGQERLGASFDNLKEKAGTALASAIAPTVNALSDVSNGMGTTAESTVAWAQGLGTLVAALQGQGAQSAQTQAINRNFATGLLEWIGVAPAASAGVDQVTTATTQLAAAVPATATAINDGTVAINTGTMALQAHAAEYAALMGVTQQSVEVSMADAAAKEEVASKTQLLTAETNAAVAAFMSLYPNIDAAGVAALATAGKIDPLLAQLIQARLRANEATSAMIAFNNAAGIKAAQATINQHIAAGTTGRGGSSDADEMASANQRVAIAANAARQQQIIATGTKEQKIAALREEAAAAAKTYGAESAEAINAQTKVIQAEQQGASKRAAGAGAAATKLEGIEQKTGDKIEQIVENTQKKITAIDEREAAKQAAALRKLNEDIATMTADRRASNEADDLDLVGVKDAKEAAKLNDREKAEADARRREQQAQSEARAQAEAGDAETAQKTLAIREKQINDQQQLDEKYYARQRELAGDPANQEALKKQYDEATRANEEAAQARIDITKQEADQKKAEVQAEKDAVIAAANEQANQVVSAAERSAQGVTKATQTARTAAVANLHAIGDAVTAIPSQKTITITVNQQGTVSASSAASSGNKAAGGGVFATTGPTTLTVGDNPGGHEIVAVMPVSGTGVSHASGNLVAMAGGGVVLVDAGGGYTTPVAGTGGGGGGGRTGAGKKAPAAIDPKKALDEMKNTVQLLMDMAKLKEQIAALAGVPAFDIPLVQALVDRAQQFTIYVATHLVPITKAEGESLGRYLSAAKEAASLISDMASLKKDIAELKNVPAFDQRVVLALIDRALQFTTAMQQKLIPLTEFEATQMSRYRSAVGDTVGILKDVADLKKTLAADTAPIISDQTIIRLADQTTRIATLVRTRILPATKEEADGLSQYAGMVGSSVSVLKDTADLTGKLFTDYTSPTDAQIGMLANDAKRVADGVMAAASSYSTEGLAAGKAYAEGVGATFAAFKDGLLFFDALKSGDFKLDTGALGAFKDSTLATLDVAKVLGAVAATIPAGDIAALGLTTKALSDQSEALIKLAAVPFGDLPGAAAGLAQQSAALLGGVGGGNTFYNTFNLPAGSTQATVDAVIKQLGQQMGARK